MVSYRNFTVSLFLSTDNLKNEESFELNNPLSMLSVYIRLLHLLAKGMRFSYKLVTGETGGELLPNGTWTGIIGLVNRSEIDIGVGPFIIMHERLEAVNYRYPFNIRDSTFMTNKPEYSPHLFGIFQTLSLPVWVLLAISFATITALCFAMMFRKQTLNKTIFHFTAVGLNQLSVIQPTTASEKILLYSWMLGTLLISFCYKSVLLSYLSFPPLDVIRDRSELAAAITKMGYNCMTMPHSAVPSLLLKSGDESLRVIGQNVMENPKGYGNLEEFIKLGRSKYAYLNSRDRFEFAKEKFFISEDNLLRYLVAIIVKKDFCCKEELDITIHRVIASGILQKYTNYFQMKYKLFPQIDNEDEHRKLTLTDISSAFVFLIFGYFISLVVLLAENLSKLKERTYSRNKRYNKGVI